MERGSERLSSSCLKCLNRPSSHSGFFLQRLVCGHSVCDKCSENTLKCPVCLRRVVVENNINEENNNSDCMSCLAKPRSVFCATCCCDYCSECDAFFHSKVFTDRHSRHPVVNSHHVSQIEVECPCHLKSLCFYCTECAMRVCEDCVTVDTLQCRTTGRKGGGIDGGEHCGHSYETLKGTLEGIFLSKIQSFLEPLEEQMRKTQLLLKQIKQRVSHLQQEEQDAKRNLCSDFGTTSTFCADNTIMDKNLTAVCKINAEFKQITRLLNERYNMLVVNVRQVARDKILKLHHQAHLLHELHTILYLLKQNHILQLQRFEDLTRSHIDSLVDWSDLIEWQAHIIQKSATLLQVDIADEVGHIPAASIPVHFSDDAAVSVLTFGAVGGPPPPERLRCCMVEHDYFAQAVTLSWTSSQSLRKKRRKEAERRLRKHHYRKQAVLFNPYENIDDYVEDIDDFGSSASDSDEDRNSLTDEPGVSLKEEEIDKLIHSLDTTKLEDLEAVETEVAKAYRRPVLSAYCHVIEMRVIRVERSDSILQSSLDLSHSFDTHGEDFVSIAEVSTPGDCFDIDICNYPNCCLQFRIYAKTRVGLRGEHSMVLTFFTPKIFTYECPFRTPFEPSTGLFYLLGTRFGTHSYENPSSSGAVNVTASHLQSGNLRSVVSEGHDGDVVVSPTHNSLFSLSFIRKHDHANGKAWIEIDITARSGNIDCEVLLIPTYYCLRSASGEGGKLRSWVLEGCRDKDGVNTKGSSGSQHDSSQLCQQHRHDISDEGVNNPWVLLSEHKNDTSLALAHCSIAAFPLDVKNFGWPVGQCSHGRQSSRAFRFFRIVNTGNNSSGNRNLELSGLELYGRVIQTQMSSDGRD